MNNIVLHIKEKDLFFIDDCAKLLGLRKKQTFIDKILIFLIKNKIKEVERYERF